jgi:hypothetical protein
LYEDTDNGTNYVSIIAPSAVTSNRTITLPDVTGTLVTNSGSEAGAFSTLAVNSNNISAENSLGFRNRIINGDMRIDQRNAGASVTLTSGGNFAVDRFGGFEDTDGAMTAQQDTSAPAGFINSIKFTTTTADATLTTTQLALCRQLVEGTNIADLGWGTANAATVTLSFWVRSSLTGTFGGVLFSTGGTQAYPFTYTISAANTWEQKSVTVAGPTTGGATTDNSNAAQVIFGLGVGSAGSQPAGAWTSSSAYSATGAISVVGTNGATFYITGVQLEAGTTASPFEYRQYMLEEQLCMRYFEKTIDGSNGIIYGITSVGGTQRGTYPFKVRKRATPTVTNTSILSSVLTVSADWVAIQRSNDNTEMIGGAYSAEL